MQKRILIVESDVGLSRSMRERLETRGLAVEETTDGKGSLELIRRTRPDLVLLAVDLSQGQNGYLICGKLKKDDDLKGTPVVIVGNPDGFAQHRKLKTHADEYLAKPVDLAALIEKVGAVIGLPEASAEEVDESISLGDLVDEPGAEEIAIDTDEQTVAGDPELDLLDAAFDNITDAAAPAHSSPPPPPPQSEPISDEYDAPLDQADLAALEPEVATTIAPDANPSEELLQLRARVASLTNTLEQLQGQLATSEQRVAQAETELNKRAAQLDAAKSSSGRNDKEVFALKDSVNKRDKEILRLKSELNEKDQELIGLQERTNALEQQAAETSAQHQEQEAQLQAASAKLDQLAAERRKLEQQVAAARDEARAASGKTAGLQGELDKLRQESQAAEAELDDLRTARFELEEQLRQHGHELEAARTEADQARQQRDTAMSDLESTQGQLTTQATAFAEEASAFRRRQTELEESSQKNEERVAKLYSRIKGDEKIREKTKKALSIAMQLLEEQTAAHDDSAEEDVTV